MDVRTKRVALILLGLSLAACPPRQVDSPTTKPTALPSGEAAILADEIIEDVRQLADPAWEGRGPGTKGGELAASYIEAAMKEAGLAPGGIDGTFFMPFEVTVDATIGDASALEDGTPSLWRAPYDFIPLASSESGEVEAEAVFVGYGLTLPEQGRDDYAGLDVKDKIVVVVRGLPEDLPEEVQKSPQAREAATLRKKIYVAKNLGAKAVIFVSPPPRPGESADDPLIPLRPDGGIGGAGILAVHARQAIVRGWIMKTGVSPTGKEATRPRNLGRKVRLKVELSPVKATVKNVIGVVKGSDPALSEEAVVIGAHYDHLGYGGASSLAPDQPNTVHPGADDNASGTAALLAIARAVGRSPTPPKRTLIFCAFAGEELGLLGSAAYVERPDTQVEKIVAMLNMDMVGRLRDGKLMVFGAQTAKEWTDLLKEASADLGLTLSESGDGYGPSDQTSFYAKNIPVLHFFTGAHEDYHRPSDTWDKINGKGTETIARLVFRIANTLADRDGRLAVITAPPPGHGGGAGRGGVGGYGAYLGTIPDFGHSAGGVKLTGVRAGSPAESAGLAGGDVLLSIGGKKVDSLQDMTFILREFKPGDEVEIVFRRGEEEKKTTAVLGKRN